MALLKKDDVLDMVKSGWLDKPETELNYFLKMAALLNKLGDDGQTPIDVKEVLGSKPYQKLFNKDLDEAKRYTDRVYQAVNGKTVSEGGRANMNSSGDVTLNQFAKTYYNGSGARPGFDAINGAKSALDILKQDLRQGDSDGLLEKISTDTNVEALVKLFEEVLTERLSPATEKNFIQVLKTAAKKHYSIN